LTAERVENGKNTEKNPQFQQFFTVMALVPKFHFGNSDGSRVPPLARISGIRELTGNNILDESSFVCDITHMDGKHMKPKTLQDAILFFSNPDNALEYMKRLRFPDGKVYCPRCGREDVVFLKNQRKWQCKTVHPKRQFSAKVGTVMEDSPIPADKWLTAVWMLSNSKNGVSSYEVAKAIGVTQKSAWFMLHRIRLRLSLNAKKFGTKVKIGGGSGPVEVDETFVGGKLKNMHKDRRARFVSEKGYGTGGLVGKTAVMGMLDRDLRTGPRQGDSKREAQDSGSYSAIRSKAWLQGLYR
jgi:transposase-like protein